MLLLVHIYTVPNNICIYSRNNIHRYENYLYHKHVFIVYIFMSMLFILIFIVLYKTQQTAKVLLNFFYV